ncbi:ATP-binding protein [Paracraurococcus lichenis]|uniref:ATP-binding protein n=1 Tax=Paracraurococcus lichenis TaxID=3064888 RepID=A0ABT9ECR8_9PROT|nr:ATP-binding protein [Paracraurococcus sp. LOR1-02]MDO9714010.1 ATP-binding protein [Paracraurococcus sp. LOR1-02]
MRLPTFQSFFRSKIDLPLVDEEQLISEAVTLDVEAEHHRTLLSLRRRLADTFTPTRPLPGPRVELFSNDNRAAFIGREVECLRITRALLEDQSHVVIFGERGRGKTSLANLVAAQVQEASFDVARYVCSTTSNFDAVMRGLFHDMPRWLTGLSRTGYDTGLASLLPSRPLQPSDLPLIFERLSSKVILLVDEFDRVADEDTRTAVADTIKQFSDLGMPVLFMIIGVSDSPEALLGRHPSIQRCVTRVALPLLKPAHVRKIVERGAAQSGLNFSASARTCIAELARGVPYMAQLLSLRAGQAALDNGRTTILGSDLLAAIEAAAIEADPRVLALYDLATNTECDAAALSVLRAAAAGSQDELGRFQVVSNGRFAQVAGLQVDGTAWQRVLNVGAIRHVRGEGPDLFTFTEAMLMQLVLLRTVLLSQAVVHPVSVNSAPALLTRP